MSGDLVAWSPEDSHLEEIVRTSDPFLDNEVSGWLVSTASSRITMLTEGNLP
jgi:hypothetical protein